MLKVMIRHHPADGDQFARSFDRLAIVIRSIVGKGCVRLVVAAPELDLQEGPA
jgi:hypothetical protein